MAVSIVRTPVFIRVRYNYDPNTPSIQHVPDPSVDTSLTRGAPLDFLAVPTAGPTVKNLYHR